MWRADTINIKLEDGWMFLVSWRIIIMDKVFVWYENGVWYN